MGFLFVTPLWIVYEISAYRINEGWLGDSRTGVDLLIKKGVSALGLYPGLAVLLPIVILLSVLAHKKNELSELKFKPVYFAWMAVESISYALLLGFLLGRVGELFLSLKKFYPQELFFDTLTRNAGSGIFEEFVFRYLLISVVVFFLFKVFRKRAFSHYVAAIFLSSSSFALVHHLSIFGEPFRWQSALFRFVVGVAFSVIFIFRGYGIAACTHSFYNVFLMFR